MGLTGLTYGTQLKFLILKDWLKQYTPNFFIFFYGICMPVIIFVRDMTKTETYGGWKKKIMVMVSFIAWKAFNTNKRDFP